MDHPDQWLVLICAPLATYRLSMLIAVEKGPARLLARLRRLPPPRSSAREGLSCPHCVGMRVAVVVAVAVIRWPDLSLWLLPWLWLALAGASSWMVRLGRDQRRPDSGCDVDLGRPTNTSYNPTVRKGWRAKPSSAGISLFLRVRVGPVNLQLEIRATDDRRRRAAIEPHPVGRVLWIIHELNRRATSQEHGSHSSSQQSHEPA